MYKRASINTKVIRAKQVETGMLLNRSGAPVTQDMEKAEVLNTFFASDFTIKNCLQESQAVETRRKVWSKEKLTLSGRGSG